MLPSVTIAFLPARRFADCVTIQFIRQLILYIVPSKLISTICSTWRLQFIIMTQPLAWRVRFSVSPILVSILSVINSSFFLTIAYILYTLILCYRVSGIKGCNDFLRRPTVVRSPLRMYRSSNIYLPFLTMLQSRRI